jgi:hypothetical protein
MDIKKSFCVLPFNHLATHPDGKVTPCCESKLYAKEDRELFLGIDSIEKVRNHSQFKQLRSDING